MKESYTNKYSDYLKLGFKLVVIERPFPVLDESVFLEYANSIPNRLYCDFESINYPFLLLKLQITRDSISIFSLNY